MSLLVFRVTVWSDSVFALKFEIFEICFACFEHLSSGFSIDMSKVHVGRVYYLDPSIPIQRCYFGLFYSLPRFFFFFLACFSGTRSFLVEIIVTFSTKSSGHGNLLCLLFFKGSLFYKCWSSISAVDVSFGIQNLMQAAKLFAYWDISHFVRD